MNRSAFCLLLGLQLSYCKSINKTSVDADDSNTICTEKWENASPVDLCKIYNWFGGLTNLFRKTGEVVSEIEDTFFIPPEYVDGHFGYGDQVKTKKLQKKHSSKTTLSLWQIQEYADNADISVDYGVDYVAPIIKGFLTINRNI